MERSRIDEQFEGQVAERVEGQIEGQIEGQRSDSVRATWRDRLERLRNKTMRTHVRGWLLGLVSFGPIH